CHFIVSLSCGVIPCGAQLHYLSVGGAAHSIERCMTSACEEPQIRKIRGFNGNASGEFQVDSKQVAHQVIDTDQGPIDRPGEGARDLRANPEGSGKTWSRGDAYSVNLFGRHLSFLKGLFDHWTGVDEVIAGGQFRDYTPILRVEGYLRVYDITPHR